MYARRHPGQRFRSGEHDRRGGRQAQGVHRFEVPPPRGCRRRCRQGGRPGAAGDGAQARGLHRPCWSGPRKASRAPGRHRPRREGRGSEARGAEARGLAPARWPRSAPRRRRAEADAPPRVQDRAAAGGLAAASGGAWHAGACGAEARREAADRRDPQCEGRWRQAACRPHAQARPAGRGGAAAHRHRWAAAARRRSSGDDARAAADGAGRAAAADSEQGAAWRR